jgi:hypothetical protein
VCFGLVGRNWPHLQACLQAGAVVIPPSVYVTVFLHALTMSLAGPTCNDDDDDDDEECRVCVLGVMHAAAALAACDLLQS